MTESVWQRLSRNSLALLVGRFAGQGIAFLTTLLVARALGAAGLGTFAYLSAIVFAGNVATTFGLDTMLIRAAARDEAAALLLARQGLRLQLILLAAFGLLILLTNSVLLNRTEAPAAALWLYLGSLVPLAYGTTYSAYLRGRERMDLYLVYTIVGQGLLLSGTLMLFVLPGRLILLTGIVLLTQIIAALTAHRLCQRVTPGFSLRAYQTAWVPGVRQLVRQAWPLALLATTALLYQRLGIFSLTYYADDTVVGQFAAAARLLEGAKAVPYAIFGALFPIMSQENHGWRHQFNLLFGILLVLVGFGTTLFYWLAPWLIAILFGREFAPAGPVLRILALSLPAFLLNLRLSFDLIANNKDRPALLAMLATLLLSLPVFLLATNRSELIGAAGATVVTEYFQAGILISTSALAGRRLRYNQP